MNPRVLLIAGVIVVFVVLVFLGLHSGADSVENDAPQDTTVTQTTAN